MFVSEEILCVLNLVSGLLSDASPPSTVRPKGALLDSLKLPVGMQSVKLYLVQKQIHTISNSTI